MELKDYTEANRVAWNEVAPLHRQQRWEILAQGFSSPGFSTLDPLVTGLIRQFPLEGWKVAQLCCNNGRELLSILNLGAAQGVGFDISDEFIADARKLTEIAGLDAQFVQSDVYDIGWEYQELFDLVYISVGALTWLPDLERLFMVVSFILKPGGNLVIYEQHPLTYVMGMPGDENYRVYDPYAPLVPYFSDEAVIDDTGLDYYGHSDYRSSRKFEFVHRTSSIINAIIRNGISLVEFNEYPHDIANMFDHLGEQDKLPLS